MKFIKALIPLGLVLAPNAQACLTHEERYGIPQHTLQRRQTTNDSGLAIGTGDRFNDGTIVPRGLGTQPWQTEMGEILSVKEIASSFKALVREYNLTAFESPYTTYENATIYGAQVGGNGKGDCSVHALFSAAAHARERGAPDNLLYFVADLLYAYKNKQGLRYGGRGFTFEEVSQVYDVGLAFIPLINPDGVAWDQQTNTCWRKNRNPAAAKPGDPNSIGVDLNRNFDFLWDFNKYFEPETAKFVASRNSSSLNFSGAGPASEPETQTIVWVLDKFPAVSWFLDIHSFNVGTVLYNWGSDDMQTTDPAQNFRNDSYNAVRGLMVETEPNELKAYREYTTRQQWSDWIYTAMRMCNAMEAAYNGSNYVAQQSSHLYPTSGSANDYVTARNILNPALSKINGYTVEFGFGNKDIPSCYFYPNSEIYHSNMYETGAGFMEFLLTAREVGLDGGGSCSGI
ncbi:uncharacterized protein L3040_004028 [Drepanopeziza brunnea f. sp. 'multigermtubi']|uniref:uncharacterized protein n=1 Tax=Drepanopeziza brunnea f. sp. 'multigermtubi' TaxID=698441 RepID=UPI002398DA25|nr:hypothetical protein L3040_004028 [Drepanopeziza brunnea f. sp. 'multigermtubi']